MICVLGLIECGMHCKIRIRDLDDLGGASKYHANENSSCSYTMRLSVPFLRLPFSISSRRHFETVSHCIRMSLFVHNTWIAFCIISWIASKCAACGFAKRNRYLQRAFFFNDRIISQRNNFWRLTKRNHSKYLQPELYSRFDELSLDLGNGQCVLRHLLT